MDSALPTDSQRHPLNQDFRWALPQRRQLRILTPAQRRDFDELGFCLVNDVFTAQEVASVVAAVDPLEREHERRVRDDGGRLRLTEVDVITFTAHLVQRSDTLRAFSQHRVFRDLSYDLIGDDVRLYWDQAVYKKTQKAQEFPWHQDNGYTFVDPQQYLTCWMPLVDVDVDNGCPSIAPRLHRVGTLAHWRTPIGLKCFEHVTEAIDVPAKAGDLIVFSSLAPHRTGPNLRPGTVRKAYILQYAPDGAVTYPAVGGPLRQDDPLRQYSILSGGA
jgi:ectoine hydroxylase-related dioxygenase (phytanoyl-CoA dioxygenase family)